MGELVASQSTRAPLGRMLGLFACVVAVDQATKAMGSLLGPTPIIRPATNPEFSLGLLGASQPLMVVLTALGIAAFGSHVVSQAIRGDLPVWVPAFLVGGAVSNLVDRLSGGAVRDFIETGGLVWNLADLAVFTGFLGYAWARLNCIRQAQDVVVRGGGKG